MRQVRQQLRSRMARERTSLIDSTAGVNVGVGTIMMHAVGGGARVSSGEHRGQVRIVLFGAVQQRSSADALEGGSGVKSTQDSGVVGPRPSIVWI